MGNRVVLLGLSLAALAAGVAYVVYMHASGTVSMAMIGLPLALIVLSWLLGER